MHNAIVVKAHKRKNCIMMMLARAWTPRSPKLMHLCILSSGNIMFSRTLIQAVAAGMILVSKLLKEGT